MRRPRPLTASLACAAACAPSLLLPSVPATAAPEAGIAVCDPGTLPTTERPAQVGTGDTSLGRTPQRRMHVPDAHRLTRGAGQTVAVVDSGVGGGLGIDVQGERIPGVGGPLASGHGTLVASLIAGPDGVAPEARILSVRAFDTPSADPAQGHRGVDTASLTAGLDRLAALHSSVDFGVVNVSLAVPEHEPRLEAAVRRLQDLDVVVVASAGTSTTGGAAGARGTPHSDAAVYPADYDGVVAVTAVGPDPQSDLLPHVAPNADTDVAAPTVGARALGLDGRPCVVEAEVSPAYATAQVSGVLALLRAHRPRESGAQAVARLLHAAEGSEERRHPWLGAGVVQAADALTQLLSPRQDGRLARSADVPSTDAPAPPQPERADASATSQQLLLRTTLACGAVLGLALLVRPLRRRRGAV